MKLNLPFLFLSAASCAMAASLRPRSLTQSCLTNGLDDLGLATIGGCETFDLRSAVRDERGEGCTNSVDEEVTYLYRDEAGLSELPTYAESISWLIQQCYHQYGCTTDLRGHRMVTCNYYDVIEMIEDHMPADCPHSLEYEMELLTAKTTSVEVKTYINEMCDNAWNSIAVNTGFKTDVYGDFGPTFMENYNKGRGYLNKETGNFRGIDSSDYPVSNDSKNAGLAIDAFKTATNSAGSGNSVLRENFDTFSNCQHQAAMCCWGRDRQSGDDNGDCGILQPNCDDADPGDNTNLCYTKDTDKTPFPDEVEGNVHCHGFAWSDDENDNMSQLKMNLHFYVAMHDHLYTRGYVEKIADTADLMCGCVEDMPAVTKSDCSQVSSTFNLRLTRDEGNEHLLSVIPNVNTDLEIVEVNFRGCQGYHPNSTPGNLIQKNNDLASHLFYLNLEGKLSTSSMDTVFDETLIGAYTETETEGEEACRASYCDKHGNLAGNHNPTYAC